jgi:hypothetical protein
MCHGSSSTPIENLLRELGPAIRSSGPLAQVEINNNYTLRLLLGCVWDLAGRIVDLIFRLGRGKRPHRREFRAEQKGLSYDWRSPGKGCYGGRLGRHGFDGDSILGNGCPS